MNVNMNVISSDISNKQDITKQANKSEDFKRFLANQDLKKYNKEQDSDKINKENLDKVNQENQSGDLENKDVDNHSEDESISMDLNSSENNKVLKDKIINLIQTAIDSLKKSSQNTSKELKSEDKATDEMSQLQQLLQLFNSMFQRVQETSTTNKNESLVVGEKLPIDTKSMLKNVPSSIDLKTLMGSQQLMPDSKSILKNNLSEIIALLEKSKGNNNSSSQIADVLEKITTLVDTLKGDLSLLKTPALPILNGNNENKSIKDNLLQKVIELSSKSTSEIPIKNQMQSSTDSEKGSKSSENSSFEEKFLNKLLGGDKDEMKISKAVNFMNQFETVKTVDASKVQGVNLVIDKSNLATDIIKNVKFMEVNNVKDLTVKMNPKELGEITIKLTMESGVMKASISAQNKDTYNLLNSNIQDINDKLKNMDIKIQSLDINIYEDSTFFNKDSNQQSKSGEQNNNPITNTILDEEDIPIINNYVVEENQVNKFV